MKSLASAATWVVFNENTVRLSYGWRFHLISLHLDLIFFSGQYGDTISNDSCSFIYCSESDGVIVNEEECNLECDVSFS